MLKRRVGGGGGRLWSSSSSSLSMMLLLVVSMICGFLLHKTQRQVLLLRGSRREENHTVRTTATRRRRRMPFWSVWYYRPLPQAVQHHEKIQLVTVAVDDHQQEPHQQPYTDPFSQQEQQQQQQQQRPYNPSTASAFTAFSDSISYQKEENELNEGMQETKRTADSKSNNNSVDAPPPPLDATTHVEYVELEADNDDRPLVRSEPHKKSVEYVQLVPLDNDNEREDTEEETNTSLHSLIMTYLELVWSDDANKQQQQTIEEQE